MEGENGGVMSSAYLSEAGFCGELEAGSMSIASGLVCRCSRRETCATLLFSPPKFLSFSSALAI